MKFIPYILHNSILPLLVLFSVLLLFKCKIRLYLIINLDEQPRDPIYCYNLLVLRNIFYIVVKDQQYRLHFINYFTD